MELKNYYDKLGKYHEIYKSLNKQQQEIFDDLLIELFLTNKVLRRYEKERADAGENISATKEILSTLNAIDEYHETIKDDEIDDEEIEDKKQQRKLEKYRENLKKKYEIREELKKEHLKKKQEEQNKADEELKKELEKIAHTKSNKEIDDDFDNVFREFYKQQDAKESRNERVF